MRTAFASDDRQAAQCRPVHRALAAHIHSKSRVIINPALEQKAKYGYRPFTGAPLNLFGIEHFIPSFDSMQGVVIEGP